MSIIVATVILGIGFILLGVLTLKHPDWEWRFSIARMLFLGEGKPTDFYYTTQKISAVFSIAAGIIIMFWGVGHGLSTMGSDGNADGSLGGTKGFKVYIDRQEISLPCTYKDIEAIGFEPCAGEELANISANSEQSIRVNNSKGEIMTIYLRNTSGADKPMEECEVYKLRAEYKVQTYEFIYDDEEDLVNGNYATTIGYTDADEGPHIRLDNGFSSDSSGDEAKDILGDGNTGVTGNYKSYTVRSGSAYINLTVGYGGLSWDDEITFITIKYQ